MKNQSTVSVVYWYGYGTGEVLNSEDTKATVTDIPYMQFSVYLFYFTS